MSDMAGGVRTATQPPSGTPDGGADRDGLATASLVLGVAGFLPIPGLVASVSAVILGSLSGTRDADGTRRRSGAAVTGIVLGCISIGLFVVICIVYFGVLGYPLPQIHRYQPPAVTNCACDGFSG
jgi:Domain of unknown function (DUF4190)